MFVGDATAEKADTVPAPRIPPRKRWKRLLMDILIAVRLKGLARPDFPVDQLQLMRRFFNHKGALVCERNNFMRGMTATTGTKYTMRQIFKWFDDMDVHKTGLLGWEGFTNSVIHDASGEMLTDWRAVEFVANSITVKGFEHKAPMTRVNASSRDGAIFSVAGDGVVAQWDAKGEAAEKFVQNGLSKNAVTTQNTCGIVDVVIGGRGPSVFVCAANKTIVAYSYDGLDLRRKFVMRESYNELVLEPRDRVFNRANVVVDTVVLMGVKDAANCIDVTMINRVETLFVGLMNGEVLTYPFGNPNCLELHPARVLRTHGGPVERIVFNPVMGCLVSCGWDGMICMTDVKDYRVTSRLTGASDQSQTSYGKRAVVEFALFPKHRLICSVSREREALVWNPLIDNPVGRLSHPSVAKAIAANDDDAQLITLSEDNGVRIFDLKTYNLLQLLQVDSDIPVRLHVVAYHPITSTLIAGGSRLHTWSMRRSGVKFENTGGHVDPATSVIATDRLIVTCDSHTIIVSQATCGKRVCVFVPFEAPQILIGIATDSVKRRVVAFGSAGTVTSFCIANGLRLSSTAIPHAMLPPSQGARFFAETCQIGAGQERYLLTAYRNILVTVKENDIAAEDTARSAAMASDIASACIVPTGAAQCTGPVVVLSLASGSLVIISLSGQHQVWYCEMMQAADGLLWCDITRRMWFVCKRSVQVLELGSKRPVEAATRSSAIHHELTAHVRAGATLVVGDQLGALHVLQRVGSRIEVAVTHHAVVDSAVTMLDRCSAGMYVVGSLTGSISVLSSTFVFLGRLGQPKLWSMVSGAGPRPELHRALVEPLDEEELVKALSVNEASTLSSSGELSANWSFGRIVSQFNLGASLRARSPTRPEGGLGMSLSEVARPDSTPNITSPSPGTASSPMCGLPPRAGHGVSKSTVGASSPSVLFGATAGSGEIGRSPLLPTLFTASKDVGGRATPSVGIRPNSRVGIVRDKTHRNHDHGLSFAVSTFITEKDTTVRGGLAITPEPMVSSKLVSELEQSPAIVARRQLVSRKAHRLPSSLPDAHGGIACLPALKSSDAATAMDRVPRLDSPVAGGLVPTVSVRMHALYDTFFDGAPRASPLSLRKSQGLEWVSRVSSLIPLREISLDTTSGAGPRSPGGSPRRGERPNRGRSPSPDHGGGLRASPTSLF